MTREDLLGHVEAKDWQTLLHLMIHADDANDRHLLSRAIRSVLRQAEPSTAPAPPDIHNRWLEHRAELLRRNDWRLPR